MISRPYRHDRCRRAASCANVMLVTGTVRISPPGLTDLLIRDCTDARAGGRKRCMAKVTRTIRPAPEGPEPDVAVEEDATPVAPDLSGWTSHPSERRDFYNRIRAFPPSVSAWRRRILERIRTGQ